ncbi:MAG: PhnD/SsuA/transferrin family substrate-binding protein [Campylobacterota bacterium]|nr:PhnD/SsuA/transferrin family substrate-binding protein [Campylobacterota bacterium]
MVKYLIIFILFTSQLFTNNLQKVNFAPLPMVKSQKLIEQYMPMLHYLEKKLNIKFNIIYARDYDTLIDKLSRGQIDIAFLGPLPYVEATSRYPQIKPLVRFLDATGRDYYTCSMFRLKEHNITLDKITNRNFALTQKYSTCGFLATQQILNQYKTSLEKNNYIFIGSHTHAILEVILGKSDLGVAKSSIVDQYSHFKLKTVAKSDPFPSFLLVYQTQHIPTRTIEKIKEALLALHPLSKSSDANITKLWGKNLKYGVVEAKDSDYDSIRNILQSIELPQ